MGKYDSLFDENNITGDSLLECDQSVLKELGISRVGDRVRMFVAVKALRAKAFGNGRKRNRVGSPSLGDSEVVLTSEKDTLAALDNVGPMPTYRTTQAQSQPTPVQNKRQSVFIQDFSTLPNNAYNSPREDESGQWNGNQLSPPLDTPRTAYSVRAPRPQVSSPNNPQTRGRAGIDDVMALNNVRYVSLRSLDGKKRLS